MKHRSFFRSRRRWRSSSTERLALRKGSVRWPSPEKAEAIRSDFLPSMCKGHYGVLEATSPCQGRVAVFNPKTTYSVKTRSVALRDFHDYAELYVVRPPYQRKNVWSRTKKQALLDSLFRRYYVPRLVLREIRVGPQETKREVVDGQQRIATAQEFFAGDLVLPDSLNELDASLPGAAYGELPAKIRKFIDRELVYDVDIVENIEDPKNPEHQSIAAEIFWRLQQGEKLNYMEEAHGRLASLPRNFVVKYADDIAFDYEAYQPLDGNPSKHPFFEVIDRNNDRMQHLALLSRLLILEDADEPVDINAAAVRAFIEDGKAEDGIGNFSYEDTPEARKTLSHMRAFYQVFEDDPMVTDGEGMKEFQTEYFIISTYLLLRHLRMHYVFAEEEAELFRDFVIDFHDRWRARREDDSTVLVFSDNRQQTEAAIAIRQRIIRQLFFEFAEEQGVAVRAKDPNRRFNEAERIALYRRAEGLCHECLAEGRSEEEALVPWQQYEADHVLPHSRGGETRLENAQLLCRMHNRQKGAAVAQDEDSVSAADSVR